MRKVYFFVSLILSSVIFVSACKGKQGDDSPSTDSDKELAVQMELAEIDMNDVDSYPLFKDCSDLTNKKEQRNCFEKTFFETFTVTLTKNRFTVIEPITDTIVVIGKVDNHGNFIFEKTLCEDRTRELFPKLDSLIRVSLNEIPSVTPALKRGVQVNTQFRAPLIVNVK